MGDDLAQPGRAARFLAGPWPVVAVLLIAAVLRFYHLDEQPLWDDEGATWRYSRMSLYELWLGEGRRETNPPLYYTLQRAWRVFGESEFALRSLSAAFGVLAVGLMYGYARRVGGWAVGLGAALLLATSAVQLQFSRTARGYPALLCAALGAMWALTWLFQKPDEASRLIHRRTAPAWTVYTLCTIIALYLHNSAFALPALTTLAAAVWWATAAKRRPAFIVNWIIVHVVALAAWAFWLPAVLGQAGAMDHWWVADPSLRQLRWVTQRVFGQYWIRHQPWVDLLFVACPCAGIVRFRRRPVALLMTALFALGLPLVLLAASFHVPMFLPRTLLWAGAPWLVLVAAGALWPRRAWLAAPLLALLVLIQVKAARVLHGQGDSDGWNTAAAYVRHRAQPTDLILFGTPEDDLCFDYYWRYEPAAPDSPDQFRGGRVALALDDALPPAHAVLPTVSEDELDALFAQHLRIWLVTMYHRPRVLAAVAPHGDLADERIDDDAETFIYLFERRGRAP